MLNWIKRNQVLAYVILAYCYSWIIWAPLAIKRVAIILRHTNPDNLSASSKQVVTI
ncbi:MAG: hypothetical protein JW954_05935 [Dehalococcoidaceae bacterium]|nr:hypothetical protein [Dehalococcoidaceae bacterium]